MNKPAHAISAIALFLLILSAGCGDRTVTVNIDVLSFLDSTTVKQDYGIDPSILPDVPVAVDSDPQELNLSEGLSDLTDIERVDLYVSAEFANQTGSAQVVLMVFVSDTLTAPYDDNIPADRYLESEPFRLEPGVTDTLHASALGSQTLGELLTSEKTRVGIRMQFDPGGSEQPVIGVATLIRFKAVVVGKRDIN